jgi:hypothetical protein
MAWTAPRTYVPGELVTAAMLNTHVRDNLLYLKTATDGFSLSAAWPVGSIFTATVSTNPATLLGFGTWAAHGTGRVLVAIDATQTEFDTGGETGGAKTHSHTGPSHTHAAGTLAGPSHTHSAAGLGISGTTSGPSSTTVADVGTGASFGSSTHTHGVGTLDVTGATAADGTGAVTGSTGAEGTGATSTVSNLMPYEVVYRWRRTA